MPKDTTSRSDKRKGLKMGKLGKETSELNEISADLALATKLSNLPKWSHRAASHFQLTWGKLECLYLSPDRAEGEDQWNEGTCLGSHRLWQGQGQKQGTCGIAVSRNNGVLPGEGPQGQLSTSVRQKQRQ